MQNKVEEVLVLLLKLLRELQSLVNEKNVVSVETRIGGDLFGTAAPDIGEVVSGRKKSKHLQKMCEQKFFGNNWEVEKNPSVEPDPFLKKIDRKPVALLKTFLTTKK